MAENNEQKNKSTKLVNVKHIRLGFIVYLMIFAYLVFVIISFSFSKKTNYTIVEPGKMVEIVNLSGVIVREETVVNSRLSGSVSHFAVEGEKVKKGSLVSVVDQNGEITTSIYNTLNQTEEQKMHEIVLSDMNLKTLNGSIKNYVLNLNPKNFGNNYSAKEYLKSIYFDMAQTTDVVNGDAVNQLIGTNGDDDNFYFSPQNGVISYQLDGYEYLNVENIDEGNVAGIVKLSAKEVNDVSKVELGAPLYKVIDNYKWYIVTEIDSVCKKFMEDKKSVNLQMDNYHLEISAKIERYIESDAKTYVILSIDRFLNDYLNGRNINFSIEYTHWEGIKVPTSALTEKEFMVIPTQALNNKGKYYEVMKKVITNEETLEETIVPVVIPICAIDNETAYIPRTTYIDIGDEILYGDGAALNNHFVIQDVKPLKGVYVINKGYADFKLVDIIASDDDYLIIDDNTNYGVCSYDKVASDASKVKENQIID